MKLLKTSLVSSLIAISVLSISQAYASGLYLCKFQDDSGKNMTLKIDLSNKEIAEIETDKDASVTANWDLLYSVEASTYCGTRANPRPGGSVYCPFKTEQDSSAGLTTVDLWCQYRFQDTLFEDLTTGTLFLSNKTLSGSFQCGGEFSSDLTYDFKFSNCVSP